MKVRNVRAAGENISRGPPFRPSKASIFEIHAGEVFGLLGPNGAQRADGRRRSAPTRAVLLGDAASGEGNRARHAAARKKTSHLISKEQVARECLQRRRRRA